MEQKAADLVVYCLENEGARFVFGIPGEETLAFSDALDRSEQIQFIPVRHEQGAAFMADMVGRLTGKPGVCLGTLGPGGTNLITGIADATLDRAPLVAFTGQASLDRAHKESHQYVDIVDALQPLTKWNASITSPSMIPEAVRKAFRLAQAEKPGATHLELPEDVMTKSIAGHPLPVRKYPILAPIEDDLQRASEIIREAKKPLILAGNGVIRSHAHRALRRFTAVTGLSVIHTFMGKGVMDARHPNYLFTAGLRDRDYAHGFLGEIDTVIAIGYDLVEWSPAAWNPDSRIRVVCVDTAPAETDSHYCPEVELIGDIEVILGRLEKLCGAGVVKWQTPDFGAMSRSIIAAHAIDKGLPVKPQKALYDLRELLSDDDVVISDVGAHKLWVSRFYPAYEPNTVLVSNGLATMGFALPGAIAARLVLKPSQKIVALCGDGGFLMNVQELETAKRLRLQFMVIVWTDSAYGVIEWHQKREIGRVSGTRFNNPDFLKLAEAFGVTGFRVTDAVSHYEVLQKAISTPGISMVEVPIDYRENDCLAMTLGDLVKREGV
ncbi:MAG: acetolactate synthase large subunit [Armatimonadetes bacterium]|nr:acetolactate synthase large subunit [Armatimonadota bacterium]